MKNNTINLRFERILLAISLVVTTLVISMVTSVGSAHAIDDQTMTVSGELGYLWDFDLYDQNDGSSSGHTRFTGTNGDRTDKFTLSAASLGHSIEILAHPVAGINKIGKDTTHVGAVISVWNGTPINIRTTYTRIKGHIETHIRITYQGRTQSFDYGVHTWNES